VFPDNTDKKKAEGVTETFFFIAALARRQWQPFDDGANYNPRATALAIS
jgi:hypothetical protein